MDKYENPNSHSLLPILSFYLSLCPIYDMILCSFTNIQGLLEIYTIFIHIFSVAGQFEFGKVNVAKRAEKKGGIKLHVPKIIVYGNRSVSQTILNTYVRNKAVQADQKKWLLNIFRPPDQDERIP